MKNKLLILLTFYFFNGYSQSTLSVVHSECATQMPSNYLQFRNSVLNTTQNFVSSLNHNICVNKKFSIVFYVIADSTGGWGSLTQAKIDTCMVHLNKVFKQICVTFVNCSTVVIPNHPFNRWSKDTIDPVVTSNWYTDKTINFYIPETVLGEANGYAYFPGGKDVVVVEKGSMTGVTPIHEMGHIFGLPHTFAEIGTPVSPGPPVGATSYEYVARTNCYLNGDGFCDTEADCYPLNFVLLAVCKQVPGAKDGHNDYYTVPLDNYMSYFDCRCRFTQEQYNFMANVMLTSRHYLH